MKNVLYILLIIICCVFIFPWFNMDTHYVLTNNSVSCNKNTDKCKIFIKNTGLILKEFNISEINKIYTKVVYSHRLSRFSPCICINCPPKNACTEEIHKVFLVTKDNTNILATGLITREPNDEFYEKFENYLNDKNEIELNYSINNFDIHMKNIKN